MISARPARVGPLFRTVIYTFVVLVSLSIVLGVILIAFQPDEERFIWQAAGSTWMLGLCFGVFVATGAVMRRRRIAIAMWLSSLFTVAATVLAYLLIWGGRLFANDEDTTRSLATYLVLGVGLGHSGVLWIITTHSRLLMVTKLVTITALWTCAVPGLVLIWYEALFDAIGYSYLFWILPLLSVAALMTLVGTIIVPAAAVSRANRPEIPSESIAARVKVLLECPKCSKRQELGVGNVRCINCKASIFVEVQEPRCECGYLLYQLQGDRCPECGREVPEADRWAGAQSADLSRT